jgi:hypothetical protein
MIWPRFALLVGFVAAVVVGAEVWRRIRKNPDTPEQDREK